MWFLFWEFNPCWRILFTNLTHASDFLPKSTLIGEAYLCEYCPHLLYYLLNTALICCITYSKRLVYVFVTHLLMSFFFFALTEPRHDSREYPRHDKRWVERDRSPLREKPQPLPLMEIKVERPKPRSPLSKEGNT